MPNEGKMDTLDPMKNDLILERIFDFCDVSTLKNIRLTSSKWRDLSIKAWRGKAVVQLFGSEPYLKFNEFLKLIDSEEDDDTLKLRKRPFQRYSVKFVDYPPLEELYALHHRTSVALSSVCRARHVKILWDSEDSARLYLYLQSILEGNSLESLEINWSTITEPFTEPEMPLVICSNLKRLTLFTRFQWAGLRPERTLYEYLFKSFPNLEALSVVHDGDGQEFRLQLVDRHEIVKRLKDLKDKLSLKEHEMMQTYSITDDLEHSNDDAIIQDLSECKFPLERLSYHVTWCGEGEIPILKLLKSCKDTLQYFEIAVSFMDSNRYIANNESCYDQHVGRWRKILKSSCAGLGNSYMKVLKELRVVNGLHWAIFFLAQLELPVLEKVIVEHEENINPYKHKRFALVEVESFSKVLERLEIFEVHQSTYCPDLKTIEKLTRMMPNLTHLKIALDKSTFPLICQHFKGLKTLIVLAAEYDSMVLDDKSLTGLSKAQLKDGGIGPRAPNITDLKYLSDFRIDCEGPLRWDNVKFTEYSVVYGFLQLPRLYYLSVAIKELSEEMKEKLLNHVTGNVDLQRKPADSVTYINLKNPDWNAEEINLTDSH